MIRCLFASAALVSALPASQVVVSGTIQTPMGNPLVGLEVSLSGAAMLSTTTDNTGSYTFLVESGFSYTLTPVAPDNPIPWVEQEDLDRVTNHILGVEPFSSPFQLIAADVNRSDSVTALDVIQMGDRIGGSITRFPNHVDWTFIDAGFVFSSPTNPWASAIPGEINVNPDSDSSGNNFIAVATGDLNGTASSFPIPEPSGSAVLLLTLAGALGLHRSGRIWSKTADFADGRGPKKRS